jgi:hypothetical protein
MVELTCTHTFTNVHKQNLFIVPISWDMQFEHNDSTVPGQTGMHKSSIPGFLDFRRFCSRGKKKKKRYTPASNRKFSSSLYVFFLSFSRLLHAIMIFLYFVLFYPIEDEKTALLKRRFFCRSTFEESSKWIEPTRHLIFDQYH